MGKGIPLQSGACPLPMGGPCAGLEVMAAQDKFRGFFIILLQKLKKPLCFIRTACQVVQELNKAPLCTPF